MNAADRRAVVVDEAEESLGPVATDRDFLRQFALHAGLVRVVPAARVHFADVPADADRAECLEALLGAGRPAAIVEQVAAALQHDVRDELLEAGVGLDLGARAELERGRIEDRAAIRLIRGRKP